MKKITQISKISLLFVLFINLNSVWSQQSPEVIYKTVTLDIKVGLGLISNSNFGVKANGNGKILIRINDKFLYDRNNSSKSYMYGFEAEGNTNNSYVNKSFGINERHKWYCYGKLICSLFGYKNDGYFIYDDSNSLKLFRKALHARTTYVQKSSPYDLGFYNSKEGEMEVILTIVLSNGAKLSDIQSIKLPGVELDAAAINPNRFEKIAIIGNSGYQGSQAANIVSNFIKNVVKPDMILSAGNDSYSRGNAPGLADYYGAMVDIKRYFSVPGNLDYTDSDKNHTGTKGEKEWLQNFNRSNTNYSYSLGEVEFFMINTNNRVGPGTTPIDNEGWREMNTWLKQKLLASNKKYKIVVGHHSAYRSGQTSSLLHTIDFKAMGVDMYISAGSNFYERHNINGIPHVNVGLGGMKREFTKYQESSGVLVENTHFAGNFGVLTAIEVPNGLKFEFLAVDGHKKDEFYLTGWQDNYYNQRGSAITNNDESMDVYLILGQSNASARCAGSLCWKYDKGYPEDGNFSSKRFPDEMGELDNTYLLNEFGGFEKATYGLARYSSVGKVPFSQAIGVGWTFAKKLTKNGKKLGLIVNSRGGTAIDVWQKKYAPSAIEKAEYRKYAIGYQEGNLYNETKRRLSAALKRYPNAKFKGVIWLHGESDATKVNNEQINYATETGKFINAIRTDFAVPELPFLITEVSKRVNPLNRPKWSHTMVNEQIHNIAKNDANVKVASVNGLTAFDAKPENNDVGIHWDHTSYRTLGERLAEFVLDSNLQNKTASRNEEQSSEVTTILDSNSVLIYPNPSKIGNFTLMFDLKEKSTISYKLVDLRGRVVLSNTQKKVPAGLHKLQVGTEKKIKTGVYFINFTTNKISVVKKIIVE